jgi:hypothetical protein
MQHSPMNEATALMLIALPDVAISFLSSLIAKYQAVQQNCPCWIGGHFTVP